MMSCDQPALSTAVFGVRGRTWRMDMLLRSSLHDSTIMASAHLRMRDRIGLASYSFQQSRDAFHVFFLVFHNFNLQRRNDFLRQRSSFVCISTVSLHKNSLIFLLMPSLTQDRSRQNS